MARLGFIKWALIISLVFLVTSAVVYYYYVNSLDGKVDAQGKPLVFSWPNYLKTLGLTIGILAFVTIAIVFLISILKGKGAKNAEMPKIPVDTWRAIQLWKTQWIKNTRIDYVNEIWMPKSYWVERPGFFKKGEPSIRSIPEDAVEIRNEYAFVDPSGQTGDKFLGFECWSRAGDRIGVHSVVISIDYGEDFIKNNWNMRVKENTSRNVYDLDNKKFPLTSSKNTKERMLAKIGELREEGYSDEQLKEYMQYLEKEEQAEKKIEVRQVEAPATSTSAQSSTSSEEEIEESPEDDAEAYRQKQKR